jgi:hypothetical protein
LTRAADELDPLVAIGVVDRGEQNDEFVDQQVREAERLTTDAPDDETLLRASASLAELREALGRVERMLSHDGTTG